MTRPTQRVPACPLCGALVHKTHTCKVSALTPRPKPQPSPTPPPAPARSSCLHAVTCLDVRAGRPCPLVAPKPANFDDLVEEARRAAAYDQALLEDVGL